MSSYLDELAVRATQERYDLRSKDRLPLRQGRKLTPTQQGEVQRKHSDGWTIEGLVTYYGVNRRTIYRCLHPIVTVKVGDYVAPFRLSPGHSPQRIGPWERAT